MKMNKIRIVKATVDGKESLIIGTFDPDGRKVCMTITKLNDNGVTEVIVSDDGFIASKEEVGYEDFEETYKAMWEK